MLRERRRPRREVLVLEQLEPGCHLFASGDDWREEVGSGTGEWICVERPYRSSGSNSLDSSKPGGT